jgi:uncharacterized membrane-anchored protein
MKFTLRHVWVWFAALLPVVGLLVLVARAEVAVRSGPVFRVPIKGYDPRDLLHGQYLQYQFEFSWQGADDCRYARSSEPRSSDEERSLQSGCCLCLTGLGFEPNARHVDCENEELSCDALLTVTEVLPPLRYFVPEDRAKSLERALNDSDAAPPSVEFALPAGGKPAIKELYLGDAPWREVLGD